MKKSFLVLGLSMITFGSFANEIKVDKNNEKESLKNSECCTATLTYNGVPVDSETVCGFITTGDNCQIAKDKLLDRNPAAKKALKAI
ncbi:hypothetical protein [Flavobacterium sp.]|uniref:hypothetical protein n=1 Tax=Flavobacterium sp. TaxID=239 RepID=UPI00333EDF42